VEDRPTGERNVLVDIADQTQEIADLIEGPAEAMSRIEVLEAAHGPVAPFHSSVILFQHVVLILAGAVVDIRAEFLGDGFGIAGVSVGGDLFGLNLGDRPGRAEERLGGGHVAGFAELDVDQAAPRSDRTFLETISSGKKDRPSLPPRSTT
jgi:hypothetical protein